MQRMQLWQRRSAMKIDRDTRDILIGWLAVLALYAIKAAWGLPAL